MIFGLIFKCSCRSYTAKLQKMHLLTFVLCTKRNLFLPRLWWGRFIVSALLYYTLGHPAFVCYENGIAGFKNKYQKPDAENCPESWPPMMSDVSGLNLASGSALQCSLVSAPLRQSHSTCQPSSIIITFSYMIVMCSKHN